MQLILDVEALGKDAETLGINVGNVEAFVALNTLVQNNDRELSVRFNFNQAHGFCSSGDVLTVEVRCCIDVLLQLVYEHVL